jgi:DNA (cytosine-5)-methyltransferase 1
VLQAGHYGVPQSRRRVIICGVKRGSPLNEWPLPSHCFPKQGSLSMAVDYGDSPCRYDFNKRAGGLAPHGSITVWDACSDLPAFEFKNPHKTYSQTDAEREELERRALAIKQFDVVNRPRAFVGVRQQPYATMPLSEFQRYVRQGCGEMVYDHIARAFNDVTIERICRVPLRAGADHSGTMLIMLNIYRRFARKVAPMVFVCSRICGEPSWWLEGTVWSFGQRGYLLHSLDGHSVR